jgi:hypothetical protein
MISIDTSKDLNIFRQQNSGSKVLELLSDHEGRLLIEWQIGVGKSFNIDDTIYQAIHNSIYDLVIVLAPTRRIINERKWVSSPPSDIVVKNLLPRPSKLCSELDEQWSTYENHNLGSLARKKLCGDCLNKSACTWIGQFGKGLAGAQVIFATQAYLERSPYFISQLKRWAGSERALTILDEANFTIKTTVRTIDKAQLDFLKEELILLSGQPKCPSWVGKWARYLNTLLKAAPYDLECGDWTAPSLSPDAVLELQKWGYGLWGSHYSFIGYELQLLGFSLPSSREVDEQQNLLFSVQTQLPGDFIIYSGSTDQELTQHRLGQRFPSPFADYRFYHPGTIWYNIASRIGASTYFRNNSNQIFDFFSHLIADRLASGKRVLLVSKKQFVPLCKKEIRHRLNEMGCEGANVVIAADELSEEVLSTPLTVLIIHYGMIGTNLFEDFDCCFCLNGYYINEVALHDAAQDLYRQELQIRIEVGMQGAPLRRYARVRDRKYRFSEVESLAQASLEQLEIGTVLQAVGRVRPYTKPREIILFQCSAHPDDAYTEEFQTLGEARGFFQIPTKRAMQKLSSAQQICQYRTKGLNQSETAEATGLSLSTVKRHWNVSEGVTNPYIYTNRVRDTLQETSS